jgi:hypothetical protein
MSNAQEGCDARRNLHNSEINGKAIEVLRSPRGPGINTTVKPWTAKNQKFPTKHRADF